MIYDEDKSKIIPQQLNLHQLEKFFPILNQTSNKYISIIENNTKLPTDSSKVIVLSGDVDTQILPNARLQVGLEYRIINLTPRNVKIVYNNLEWYIQTNGVWQFNWLGLKWYGSDTKIYQYVTNSLYNIITPSTSSKIIVFKLLNSTEDSYEFILKDGNTDGVEYEFKNESDNIIYIKYNTNRYLTLPPQCVNIAKLIWKNKWLNLTEDEWVYINEDIDSTNKFVIHKDILESNLHILRKNNSFGNIKISNSLATNTRIYCTYESTEIATKILFYDENTDINLYPENFITSMSSIIFDMLLLVDNYGKYKIDSIKSNKNCNISINSILNNQEFCICGMSNSLNLFISGNSEINKSFILFNNRESDYLGFIRNGSELNIANKTNVTCTIGYKNNISSNIKYYTINPKGSLNLIYSNNDFEYNDLNPIVNNFAASTSHGYLISNIIYNTTKLKYDQPLNYGNNPVKSFNDNTHDVNVEFYIYKGTKFQFGENQCESFMYYFKEDTLIKSKGLPYLTDTSEAEDYTYFDFNSKTNKFYNNSTVGKDLYIYICAIINKSIVQKYYDNEFKPDEYTKIIITDAKPTEFENYIVNKYDRISSSLLIGGFHYGIRRHTTKYNIPLTTKMKIPNMADVETILNENGYHNNTEVGYVISMYPETNILKYIENGKTWYSNVSIGVVPNSVWDLQNHPLCYEESNNSYIGGMVKVGNIWVDIYREVFSTDEFVVSNREALPKFGLLPHYTHSHDYCTQVAYMNNKRLLTLDEWRKAAQWTPYYTRTESINEFGCTINSNQPNGCGVNLSGIYTGNEKSCLYAISAYNICGMTNQEHIDNTFLDSTQNILYAACGESESYSGCRSIKVDYNITGCVRFCCEGSC